MSDAFVHVSFLTLIEDLDTCCQYSWGSAVLACLYRNLCKAAKPSSTTIAGPLMLLQLWAWSRIPFTSPIQPPFEFPPSYRINQPYGFRWKCPLQWRDTARHSVSVYRDRLQALHESEFIWTPYDVVSQHLPAKSVNDCLEWLCDTVVIFWEIVEECQPSRVLRQFGFFQDLPANPSIQRTEHNTLHNISRRGTAKRDWIDHHARYIQRWSSRRPTVCSQTTVPTTCPGYMTWYLERTVLLIRRPGVGAGRYNNLGGNFSMAVDGLSQVRHNMEQMIGAHQQSQQFLQPHLELTQQYLHLTDAEDRIHHRGTRVFDLNTVAPDSPPVMHQVQRVRNRRGRRQREAQNQEQQAPSVHSEQQAPSFHSGQQAPSVHSGQQAPSFHYEEQATPSSWNTYDFDNIFDAGQNMYPNAPQNQFITPPQNDPFMSQ